MRSISNIAIEPERLESRFVYQPWLQVEDFINSSRHHHTQYYDYYLETVYYKDKHEAYYPLALLLHCNTHELFHDPRQCRWLKHIAANIQNGSYQEFPHWVLLTQHTLFFTVEPEGSEYTDIQDSVYTGCYQRQIGCQLRECGFNLSQWLLYAHSCAATAVLENYGHTDLPRLQVAWGRANRSVDYKTMLPGLIFSYVGAGYGRVKLEVNGYLTLKYYRGSCSESALELLSRRYNHDAHPILGLGEKPESTQLPAELFNKTRHAKKTLKLLGELVKKQDVMDWRLLAWTLLTCTDWGRDIYKRRISSQLFQPLLTVSSPQSELTHHLTPRVLQSLMHGIEHCFNYYLHAQYQGYFSTLFRQLALWHQALSELSRLIIVQSHESVNQLSAYSHRQTFLARAISMKQYLDEWSHEIIAVSNVDYTLPEDDQASNNASQLELNIPGQQPALANEFAVQNQANDRYSTNLSIQIAHTLDDVIAHYDLLATRLKGACLKALLRRFGDDNWLYYALYMQHYNEFAQVFVLMGLIQRDLVQALSSLFAIQPSSWLSHNLESELVGCYIHDQNNPDRCFFNGIINKYLANRDEQQQGQILRQLVQAKPPCLDHLLASQGHFNLTRQPLVKEQLYQTIGWQLNPWYDQVGRYYRQKLYDLSLSWVHRLITGGGYFSVSTHRVFSEYFQRLNEQLTNHDQQSVSDISLCQSELQLKYYLDDKKQKHPYHHPWYSILNEITEWMFTGCNQEALLNKQQLKSGF